MQIIDKILRNLVKATAYIYWYNKNLNKKSLKYIPASGKLIGKEELFNMIDASLDMWLTTGRFNSEFEDAFARYFKVPYCHTVNSGSSANLIALSALTSHKLGDRQVTEGSEVITVAAGFPTTINPIVMLGLVPVFVDCKVETCNIDVSKIEEAITPKTKVIMLAHTMGNVYNLDEITKLCKKYNLWLIEDNCDAFGSQYDGKYTGTIGDIGTFSFYPAHFLTMGEGGAIITKNVLLNKIIKSYRDWGRDCWCEPGHDNTCNCRFEQQFGKLPIGYDHKYVYSHLGYNMKITDWQAAIGCAQLKKVDLFIKKRRENFELLFSKLKNLEDYFILPKIEEKCTPSWFGFLITLKPECHFTKQELVEYLENNGIGTRQLFAGNILRQPSFVENNIKLRIGNSDLLCSSSLTEEEYNKLPNTDYIMNNTFWVGVHPALGNEEINMISDTIKQFVDERR